MTITAVQTTMTTTPAAGAPGMLYDSGDECDIVTKVAAEAIPFGSFVRIATDGTCNLPDAANEVNVINRGLALHDPGKASGTGYAAGDLVQVMIRGRAWIQAEAGQTLAAYSIPFVRQTATPPEALGAFRSDADTTDATQPLGVHMFAAATSGGLGVVQFNPPGT